MTLIKNHFFFEVILTVHRRYYVEIKYQLDATDDIYCRFYCMLTCPELLMMGMVLPETC